MIIPYLKPKNRSREYNSYKESLRDEIVYNYLFYFKSHRDLDEEILGLNSAESRGYQSMGILHYFGLRGEHKGVFADLDILTGLNQLKSG